MLDFDIHDSRILSLRQIKCFAKINVIDFNLFVQIVNGSRSTRIKDVSCIGVPFPTVPGNNIEIIR